MKNTIFALNTVHKQVAAMLIATILMWVIGAPLWMVSRANAAQLVNVSDVLSDSDTGVVSNHKVSFTTSDTGTLGSGGNFILTFESGFVLPDALNVDDFDLYIGGVSQTLGSTWTAAVATTSRTVTFTQGGAGDTIATDTLVEVFIGTNATSTAGTGPGVDQIVNPSPGAAGGVGTSYTVTITSSGGGTDLSDSAETRIVIIDDITMTASVDTTLTFNIYGTASSTDINGESTFATSTATSMAFGTLNDGVAKTLGQRLTVATNALNGFSVTVVQDQNLLSASNADIDLFVHGDATTTPLAWVAPVPNVADENTWGHYGITSSDDVLSTGDPFGTQLFAGNFASSTPLEIFYHDGPSDGTGTTGEAYVGVKIEINALQEAANDYSNSVTYVCTPVF